MEENKKRDIRVIFSELRGYLKEAPSLKEKDPEIREESIWEQYNETVHQLSAISEKDYKRFCLEPSRRPSSTNYHITVVAYRQGLGGLISALHAEYFTDEPNPLDAVPSTVISQSQQQDQSVHIQMILDIQSKIDEKISKCQDGTPEKGFLQKVKSSLSSIKNVTQLLQTIFKMAKESGLDLDNIQKMFS
jgi:hypothetical protein